MPRRAVFVPYRPKTVLNKSARADHWFWSRYSAYPYLGCQHGCAFCYCREKKYSPYDDPEDFAYVIRVKENAPELLRRGLQRAPVDVVFTGDYQAAERKFGLSRRMLEVCLELGFPVLVLERSPGVLHDLDLLQALQRKAQAVVVFSVIYTPETPQAEAIRRFERLAPPVERRFAAMEKLAAAGIPTGICAMPLLPGLCDTPTNLDLLARWTANHGGAFILGASSLTLADQQRAHFFRFLQAERPDLLPPYEKLYPEGQSYGPLNHPWPQVARRLREACQHSGIRDRMPRPIIPGEKREVNKRVVERLAEEIYTLEIEERDPSLAWKLRRAAWAIDDLEQDLRLVARLMGRHGVESIPAVGPELAGKIIGLMNGL